MSSTISKGQSYRELIHRMDEAIDGSFYLEASWIAYAILEDRALSALERTPGGVPTNNNGEPIRMLGPKLCELERRCPSDADLKGATLDGQLLASAKSWKDDRNSLMHALAKEARSFNDIALDAQRLAIDGRNVAVSFANAVTRLRNRKANVHSNGTA